MSTYHRGAQGLALTKRRIATSVAAALAATFAAGGAQAFEIETGEDNYLNHVSIAITQKSLSRGVFLRPLGNTLYIMPPYCVSRKQLNQIYDVIVEILDED